MIKSNSKTSSNKSNQNDDSAHAPLSELKHKFKQFNLNYYNPSNSLTKIEEGSNLESNSVEDYKIQVNELCNKLNEQKKIITNLSDLINNNNNNKTELTSETIETSPTMVNLTNETENSEIINLNNNRNRYKALRMSLEKVENLRKNSPCLSELKINNSSNNLNNSNRTPSSRQSFYSKNYSTPIVVDRSQLVTPLNFNHCRNNSSSNGNSNYNNNSSVMASYLRNQQRKNNLLKEEINLIETENIRLNEQKQILLSKNSHIRKELNKINLKNEIELNMNNMRKHYEDEINILLNEINMLEEENKSEIQKERQYWEDLVKTLSKNNEAKVTELSDNINKLIKEKTLAENDTREVINVFEKENTYLKTMLQTKDALIDELSTTIEGLKQKEETTKNDSLMISKATQTMNEVPKMNMLHTERRAIQKSKKSPGASLDFNNSNNFIRITKNGNNNAMMSSGTFQRRSVSNLGNNSNNINYNNMINNSPRKIEYTVVMDCDQLESVREI